MIHFGFTSDWMKKSGASFFYFLANRADIKCEIKPNKTRCTLDNKVESALYILWMKYKIIL